MSDNDKSDDLPPMDMVALELHLNTGARISVDCTDYTVKKDRATQRVTQIEWTTPTRGRRKLAVVDLNAIVAIIEVRAEVTP